MTIDADRLGTEIIEGVEMRKFFHNSDTEFFSFRNHRFVVKPRTMERQISEVIEEIMEQESDKGVYQFPGGFINWVRNGYNSVSGIVGRV